MTSKARADTEDQGGPGICWCCGSARPEMQLLRLGYRPEAAVCFDCAANLRQRAGAQADARMVVRCLHRAGDRIRGLVMSVGLHNRPVVGPALRWINRRLPF